MAAIRLLRRLRDQRGAELVEMAIVTPILILILAGIFDFGFLFRSWEVLTNAAREGARVGMLPGYACSAATPDDVRSRVQAYMTASGFTDTTAYQVDPEIVPVATSAGTFSACSVRVSMLQQMPYVGIIGQFFGGGLTSVPLSATAVMRTELSAVP